TLFFSLSCFFSLLCFFFLSRLKFYTRVLGINLHTERLLEIIRLNFPVVCYYGVSSHAGRIGTLHFKKLQWIFVLHFIHFPRTFKGKSRAKKVLVSIHSEKSFSATISRIK